jgi:hypothetical protein
VVFLAVLSKWKPPVLKVWIHGVSGMTWQCMKMVARIIHATARAQCSTLFLNLLMRKRMQQKAKLMKRARAMTGSMFCLIEEDDHGCWQICTHMSGDVGDDPPDESGEFGFLGRTVEEGADQVYCGRCIDMDEPKAPWVSAAS